MTIFWFIVFSALAGCVLYLPFFLWFRWHKLSGGPLAVDVNYTATGWAVTVGNLVLLAAGPLLRSQYPDSTLGQFLDGRTGIVKWLLCVTVLTSIVATLLRGAGIALQRSPTAQAPASPATQPSRGYRVATILGVPIYVQRSYLLVGAFVAILATPDIDGIVGYCLAYPFLFAIHEAGHAVVAHRLGLKVHSVELSNLGGLCRLDVPTRPRDVWLVYAAGVATQAVVLLATLAIVAVNGAPTSPFGMAVTTTFTWVNAMLIAINLVPGRSVRGSLTDGAVLWGITRHQLGNGPHPFGWHNVPTRLFEPSTSLLSVDGLTPDGFRDGIEILNDNTTPMEFVTSMLEHHVGMAPDAAARTMLDVHMLGGVLLPLPSREMADTAADAINRETQSQGHRLVCRAVSAQAPGVLATSLAGA